MAPFGVLFSMADELEYKTPQNASLVAFSVPLSPAAALLLYNKRRYTCYQNNRVLTMT